ncbi:hypothetical protein ACP4OV_027358 [Aristida adscensionis]
MMAATTSGSDLPADTVRSIAEQADVGSRASMRAVCSLWSAAVPDETPQPWVLAQPAAAAERDRFSVLSLPASRELTLSLAFSSGRGLAGARCVGAGHGWLALVGADLSVTLHNPVTGCSVSLPPLVSHPMVVGAVRDDGTVLRRRRLNCDSYLVPVPAEEVRDTLVRKIVFSPAPEQDDYFAVQLLGGHSQYAMYARAGATQWKTVRGKNEDPVKLVNDAVHVEGSRFFAVTRHHGMVFQLDLAEQDHVGGGGDYEDEDAFVYKCKDADDVYEPYTHSVTELAPPLASPAAMVYYYPGEKEHVDNHLVLVDGELYQVWAAWVADPTSEEEDSGYRIIDEAGVVKCDLDNYSYLEVAGELDDWAVLVGGNETAAVRAGDMPAVRGNCVYFIDGRLENVVCAFDLRTQCVEAADCEMLRRAWPMGPSRLSSPPPVWFLPFYAAATAQGPGPW